MPKFMVLYNSSAKASELMAEASPEEMKASMAEWIKWKDDVSATLKLDFGMPLQATARITPAGLGESPSEVSGYSTIEGDSKDAIVEVLKTHPHLKRPGASIDLLEMLSMPGMGE